MNDVVQFKLNIPADLKAWIEAQSRRNVRSQGAEIVACLRERMERQEAMKA